LVDVNGADEAKSAEAASIAELEQLKGSLDKECFGSFGGLAKLALLEVWGSRALAIAHLSVAAWQANTMVVEKMQKNSAF